MTKNAVRRLLLPACSAVLFWFSLQKIPGMAHKNTSHPRRLYKNLQPTTYTLSTLKWRVHYLNLSVFSRRVNTQQSAISGCDWY
jgi:hypothetical protein